MKFFRTVRTIVTGVEQEPREQIILRDLHDLRLIGLQEQFFHPTRGCEFFVTLTKVASEGRAAA